MSVVRASAGVTLSSISYPDKTEYENSIKNMRDSFSQTIKETTQDADGNTIFQKMSVFSNTVDGISNTITSLSTETDGHSKALNELSTVVAVTQEDDQAVLTLGSSASTMKTRITNTELQFLGNGKVLASASGDSFRTPTLDADVVHIGGYVVSEATDGSVSIDWKGV